VKAEVPNRRVREAGVAVKKKLGVKVGVGVKVKVGVGVTTVEVAVRSSAARHPAAGDGGTGGGVALRGGIGGGAANRACNCGTVWAAAHPAMP